MELFLAALSPGQLALALAVTLFAGFVKGAIGFAMPMLMLSALGSFLPAETALAALILPTLLTNFAQAFRQGVAAAWGSILRYRWFIVMVVVFIPVTAGFVRVIPQSLMFVLLGAPIVAFAGVQLAGISLALPIHHRRRAEIVLGIIGGCYGGISGIWGPPLLIYLLSIHAEKTEAVRVQGVVFLLGAVILTLSHLGSGVLNADTAPLSALLVVPAALGMWLGFRAHDRLDAQRFRRWTLVLLLLTGVNLMRRGFGL
jgi:hypothetical protein